MMRKTKNTLILHALWRAFNLSVLAWIMAGCGNHSDPQAEKQAVFKVPHGFEMESVVPPDLISYPMFAVFDLDGRLFVFESTEPNEMETEVMLSRPSYQIRLLEDADGDGIFDSSTIFADSLPFPMGGTFYDGSLYVTASPDLIRLTDTDGDGKADQKEIVLTGWTLNVNGAILSGPFMGPDGRFYLADARRGFDIMTKEGERLQGKGARIWRCLPDGTELEWLSGGGFDNSIEIDFMPSGDPIGTMTYFRDPAEGERDALMHWVKGGVYPKPQAVIAEDGLKLTGDLMPVVTKMPRVAPSGIVRFRGSQWGKEYEGAWFTAIFNTGEILRHRIKPEGGSYKSDDEPFLSSVAPDIHPTDVLQDGNGDLLVVVTGGWFIKGCPLSQVAKPDVPGGIYRIKKAGRETQKDPWGNQLDLTELADRELERLLDDEREKVRKKATEFLLLNKKELSLEIWKSRYDSGEEQQRLDAIFALHRLEVGEGAGLVRKALYDKNKIIRTAAARLTGLNKDYDALEILMSLVVSDPSIMVRRQAATALGQIGSPKAVSALLKAAGDAEDRFLNHAIRYALITLAKADTLLAALKSENPQMRVTALIALDQMDDSPLTDDHVKPFIHDEDEKVKEAGLWVTGHHPGWSHLVVNYLDKKLSSSTLTEKNLHSAEDLLVRFCGDSKIEDFIMGELSAADHTEETRIMLLNVVKRCSAPVPEKMVGYFRRLLHDPSETLKSGILEVVEARQIKDLDSDLTALLDSARNRPVLYLKILHARLAGNPHLSDGEFGQVRQFLGKDFSVTIRRSAARLLRLVVLEGRQMQDLAQQELSDADAHTFQDLVTVFERDTQIVSGRQLLSVLEQRSDLLEVFSEKDIQKILTGYSEEVRKESEEVIRILREQNADRLRYLDRMESELVKGDVGRGRKLFFGKATCSTCHTVGSEGHDFGPDLTNIGEIRSRHDLLESIVYPSVSFARKYDTYIVRTSERSYSGILKEEASGGSIVLKTSPGQEIRIPETDIQAIEIGDVSLMPPGLEKFLSKQELSDLMIFLQALPYTVDRLIELEQ